ncbi:MAG: ParA family protein [Leptolyngbyaceae cyanobacterium bins.59]|nr:ParA family protein [Leptolyngbyaceae cyanobacterium bins.59]
MLIGVINQKGGVGKSTTAAHLAFWLSKHQKQNTLVIDADSQQSSSQWLKSMNLPFKVIDDPEEVFEQATDLADQYDSIVIDAPGVLGETTKSILLAVDLALIPVQPTKLDLASTEKIVRLVHNVQKVRKGTPKAAIFLNKAEKRSVLLREAREALTGISSIQLLKTTIYRRSIIADAPGQDATVFNLSGEAAQQAASEYEQLFKEALKYGKA